MSVVPLATTTPNPLQIVESSPAITYAQNPAAGNYFVHHRHGLYRQLAGGARRHRGADDSGQQPPRDGRDSGRESGDGAALRRLRAKWNGDFERHRA